MSESLTEAQTALSKAQSTYDAALITLQEATANAADLRAKVAADGSKVSAKDLSDAQAAVTHAQLALDGTASVPPGLAAAVQAATADQAASEIVEQLPQLGRDVAAALDLVVEALEPFINACRHYDRFVDESTHRLHTLAPSVEPSDPGFSVRRRGVLRPPPRSSLALSRFPRCSLQSRRRGAVACRCPALVTQRWTACPWLQSVAPLSWPGPSCQPCSPLTRAAVCWTA
jgi:hypothetical protein